MDNINEEKDLFEMGDVDNGDESYVINDLNEYEVGTIDLDFGSEDEGTERSYLTNHEGDYDFNVEDIDLARSIGDVNPLLEEDKEEAQNDIFNMGDLSAGDKSYVKNDDGTYSEGSLVFDFGSDDPDMIGYLTEHPGDYDFGDDDEQDIDSVMNDYVWDFGEDVSNYHTANEYMMDFGSEEEGVQDYYEETEPAGYVQDHPGDYDFNRTDEEEFPLIIDPEYKIRIGMRDRYHNYNEDVLDYIATQVFDTLVYLVGQTNPNIRIEQSDNMVAPTIPYMQVQCIMEKPMDKIYIEWNLSGNMRYVLNNAYFPNTIVGAGIFDQILKDKINSNMRQYNYIWPEIVLPTNYGVVCDSEDHLTPYAVGLYKSLTNEWNIIEDRSRVNMNLRLKDKNNFIMKVLKIATIYNHNYELPIAFEEYKKLYQDFTKSKLKDIVTNKRYINIYNFSNIDVHNSYMAGGIG